MHLSLIIILTIIVLLSLIYFSYPFWLKWNCRKNVMKKGIKEIDQVSLIYMSRNGARFLEDKIDFLLIELANYSDYELIIIDDHSEDQSQILLEKYKNHPNIKLILKDEQKGIPQSMNIGCSSAKYEYLVFCDQRQILSKGIIKKLTHALSFKGVGAVSSCLSPLDKENNSSILRMHENLIKSYEGKMGNLIGVYGPLYALKKKYYKTIPNHIILDDLYLSIKILKNASVRFLGECQIIDDDAYRLYDYKRSKRYLKGLLQLVFEKELIYDLNNQQKLMLFWHKYLRLLIPMTFFYGYIVLGIGSLSNPIYLSIFIGATCIAMISVTLRLLNITFNIQNFIQINLFYVLAFFDILLNDYLYQSKVVNTLYKNRK